MLDDTNENISSRNTQRDPVEQQQATKPPQSVIRVLHVDDSQHIVDINKRYLSKYDERIEIEYSRSASEGLDHLSEEPIDCIISDYNMPGMNGVEFLEAVRQKRDELPFIFYTSNQAEPIVTDGLAAGATDYVQKQGGTAHLKLLANKVVAAVESRHLSQTHQQLLEAFEVVEFGMSVVNKNDRVVYANDAFVDCIGKDRDEIVGAQLKYIDELIPQSLRKQLIDTAEGSGRSAPQQITNGSSSRDMIIVRNATEGVNIQSYSSTPNTRGTSKEDEY